MHDTLPLLNQFNFPAINRVKLETLQINIGLKCNQQCVHCHVNASPHRKERMSSKTIAVVKEFLQQRNVKTLDITGGAPELHPQFRELISYAYEHNIHAIDRCNLTILQEPGMQDLAEFMAEHEVEIVASLPCYEWENVDKQRGQGVFEKSIQGLQQLNKVGYGKHSKRMLNLVYNPQGATLPPPQDTLEETYKKELKAQFDIDFNQLYTLCNMPINRFGSMLVSKNELDDYMQLLKQSYQDDNLQQVMCRNLISVDWQGYVYDCDFNQMLELHMNLNGKAVHLSELMNTDITDNPISVRDHCYGCTAGQGSSCGGALKQ